MSQQLVKDILDRAITAVANDEFKRISNGMSRLAKAQKVQYALEELRKLSRGVMPEYDEWVALFYLTWYQPRQINLAYSLAKPLLARYSYDTSLRLQVVDFGCGALAMRFGLTMAIADLLEKGLQVSRVRLDMIDTSDSMIDIGKEVWRGFKRRVNRNPNLPYISRACEIITPRTNKSISKWGDDRWVTAIHTVYNDNKSDVRKELRSRVNGLKPSVLFTTTNASIESDRLLSFINPCKGKSYRVQRKQDFLYQIEGGLNGVSNWRYEVRDEISKYPYPSNVDMNFIQNYLKSSVKWDVGKPDIRLYTKR